MQLPMWLSSSDLFVEGMKLCSNTGTLLHTFGLTVVSLMNWCVTEGAEAMANDMGFVIPFDTAVESTNLFVKQDVAYTAEGKTPVSWNFPTMPSEEWKNVLGSALTAYAADQTDANWDAVVSAFVDGWATEYALHE